MLNKTDCIQSGLSAAINSTSFNDMKMKLLRIRDSATRNYVRGRTIDVLIKEYIW